MGDVQVDRDVRAFLEGDAALTDEVRTAIRHSVRSFGFPDAGLREDLIQEALGRVFISLSTGQFRGEASLKTYAQCVAKYTCLEQVRRKRFEEEIDAKAISGGAGRSGPEELLLRAEEHRKNLRTLADLPAECRELFRLIFVERLSYREVASRLGISEGGVKSRVHRCRLTGKEAALPKTPAVRRGRIVLRRRPVEVSE